LRERGRLLAGGAEIAAALNFCPARWLTPAAPVRAVRPAEASLLQTGDETVEGLLQDDRQVAAGVLVTHQISRMLQLRFELLASGELEAIPGRRKRL
jgi:hypothetical protein